MVLEGGREKDRVRYAQKKKMAVADFAKDLQVSAVRFDCKDRSVPYEDLLHIF